MDTEKPCHKRPEPNAAGYKVVVDSFSENEEVAMLFEEIGGGQNLSSHYCSICRYVSIHYIRVSIQNAKLATIMLIAKLFRLFLSFHHNI